MSATADWHSAFVLHHWPYRDTSLLLEAFTAETGRLGLIARGARRPKSRQRVILQPLQPLLIRWSGRGELKTLIAAESSDRAFELTGQSLYAGFYLNELLLRLTARDDPHPQLFERYRDSLARLGQANDDAETLRLFENALLHAIGYGVDWARDAQTGEAVLPGERYHVIPDAGPVRTVDCDDASVSGASLLALAAGRLQTPEQLRESRRVLKVTLAHYLGDRPLQTPRLARRLVTGARLAGKV